MRRSLLLIAAGAVVLAGAVAVGAILFYGSRTDRVDVTVTAYTRKPPYRVTFIVSKPPANTVVCDVYEVDFDRNPVGRQTGIVVGPAKQRDVEVTVTVPVASGTPVQPQVEQCLTRK